MENQRKYCSATKEQSLFLGYLSVIIKAHIRRDRDHFKINVTSPRFTSMMIVIAQLKDDTCVWKY